MSPGWEVRAVTEPDITDRLRQTFEARAAQVETAPDALVTIRRRIGSTRRHRRVWTVAVAGLATGMAAALTAIVLLLPWSTPATPPPVGNSPATTLPVYVVGTVAGNEVLYREDQPVPPGESSLGDRVRAALTDMVAGHTRDPHYRSDWPADLTVRSVQTTGDTVTVELGGPATPAPADPSIALQQLVYTAVAQDRNLHQVRVELPGATQLWGFDLADPLTPTDVLAPVWLSRPEEGDIVGRTFQVTVAGSVPAAVAMLIVWDAHGSVVEQQAVRLSAGTPQRGSADLTLTLSPGVYRVAAYYLADDGTAAATDDHVITVR
jgi:Sporulation and spore germination